MSVEGIYGAAKTTGVSGANLAYFEGCMAALSAGFDTGKKDQAT
jgi:hypothetical protein